MHLSALQDLFYIDRVSILLFLLVFFMGAVVLKFSTNYMQGDQRYLLFLTKISLLCLNLITLAVADNLILFAGALIGSNLLLIRLMVHNSKWEVAQASGRLAAKNFIISGISLVASLYLLYLHTGQTSIQQIIHTSTVINNQNNPALYLIILATISQSAIWPFHRWLLSSLTSPTPVSALMHAGLINGGGIILIRFSPLYIHQPLLLNILFCIALVTSIMGTIWKLIQNDYKRMLAASTVSQMGFMILQCSLGLFSAAAAHLCWHSLFKSYLFLNTGNAAKEQRLEVKQPATKIEYIYALFCGVLGTYFFTKLSGKNWNYLNTNLFLVGVALIALINVANTTLATSTGFKKLKALVFTLIFATIYGASIGITSYFLQPLELDNPQPIGTIHIIGLSLLLFAWLVYIFNKHWINKPYLNKFKKYMYVKAMNSSQPHPTTITTCRKSYA